MAENSPIPSKPADTLPLTAMCMALHCENHCPVDKLYCDIHQRAYEDLRASLMASNRKPFSIGPDERGKSYGGAVGIIGMAVASSAAIENPLYRTLAILGCAFVAYLLGLRTQ